jgi:hypothetical protein
LGSNWVHSDQACQIGPDLAPIDAGNYEGENEVADGCWTHSLESVWCEVRACYAALTKDIGQRYGVWPTSCGASGISTMMHGYLAFDAASELLLSYVYGGTPRLVAAAELIEALGFNVPKRWSIAHLYPDHIDRHRTGRNRRCAFSDRECPWVGAQPRIFLRVAGGSARFVDTWLPGESRVAVTSYLAHTEITSSAGSVDHRPHICWSALPLPLPPS